MINVKSYFPSHRIPSFMIHFDIIWQGNNINLFDWFIKIPRNSNVIACIYFERKIFKLWGAIKSSTCLNRGTKFLFSWSDCIYCIWFYFPHSLKILVVPKSLLFASLLPTLESLLEVEFHKLALYLCHQWLLFYNRVIMLL